MALTAILAELVLMRVFVAAGAVAERNTPELLERFAVYCLFPVAFRTVDGLMLPDQGKPRIGVVELRGRLE
jgi:hypothetical protein